MLLCALILAAILADLLYCRYGLTVSQYSISAPKLTDSLRIVQLSDLHNREFGNENQRLLDAVQGQKPDLILVTGDCVTRSEPEMEITLHLLRGLTEIAPVYVSLGNHECDYAEAYAVDVAARFAQTGATVLDKSFVDVEIKGQKLRIGGVYGYCLPAIYLKTGEASAEECAFLEEFQNTDRQTILLCHMPVCWIENGSLSYWSVDTVFSGHAHGGQIRLPFIGGLIAPDQGLFPGEVAGVYTSENGQSHLILSRGLGSSVFVPRLFNVPEIVTAVLNP